MFSYILLIISVGVVIGLYMMWFINYFVSSKKYLEGYSGFDVAKMVTTNYDSINIVSSNENSKYDIDRNVIRLSSKNYDGNSYFDIVVSTILAGYSLVNSENKDYFKFSLLVKKIGCISLVPVIMVVMSCFVSSIGDAKIALVLFVLFLIYQYMRYMIAVSGNEITKNNLDKKIFSLIESILNSSVTFYKLSFIVSLIMIGRLIVIIIGM